MSIKRLVMAAAIALSALAAGSATAQVNTATQVVRVEQGQARGVVEDGVARFMGLPYAKPPVGELRWRAPEPAESWSGVRDAAEPGPDCQREREDCLYLNIYRPADARPGDDLPVMVWIHGGAFRVGASTGGFGAVHDGTEFAKKDIITVTINYRLGRAGWFAHPALTAEGQGANFGIQDQIAALEWVQDNIGRFGGDADNVTIFGESAGAISVIYLMLNDDADGLFAKAISESGFPRNAPTPLDVAEGYGIAVAEANGIEGASRDAANALRQLDLTTFPAGQGFDDQTRPYPILDGRDIQWDMTSGFEEGHQAMVPFMIGGNSNEASLYRPDSDVLAAQENLADIRRLFGGGSLSDTQVINDYITHQRMTEPNRNLAREHTSDGQPTYLYYFSFVPAEQRARSLGAAHTAEINYVFAGVDMDGEEFSLAQQMNAYWASFAKYGDPGAAGGPRWPQYDPATDATMVFGNEGVFPVNDLLDEQLDYLEAQAQ